MADAVADAVGAGVGEEVKAYKIHIPTKHLEVTKQKLEATRLPHEGPSPSWGKATWWAPKSEVEQLIDFWLERYSWRDQESVLNTAFPQFRASIAVPSLGIDTPLRIHFVHARSPHPSAVPLLLLPPFPFTNLSLLHLVQPLIDPPSLDHQAFHVVIPALPGLGFSDPLPSHVSSSPIAATATVLDVLMTSRLGYARYLATTTCPGHLSPSKIDWHLARQLATDHTTSCVGTHLISPPLTTPTLHAAPWEWTKWTIARFFRAGVLGYSDDDFVALERVSPSAARWLPETAKASSAARAPPSGPGLNALGPLWEPNALSYALCDSPAGMLVFVLRALRLLGRKDAEDEAGSNGFFSPERIVTLTKLAWLPGPEYALRFWAACADHEEDRSYSSSVAATNSEPGKPKVAVTVFVGTGGVGESGPDDVFACPAWANAEYDVVHTQRLPGRSGVKGLLAYEQPDVIFAGVRELASAILARDPGAFSPPGKGKEKDGTTALAPLESVVVVREGDPEEEKEAEGAVTPKARAKPKSAMMSPAATITAVMITKRDEKGKGKAKDAIKEEEEDDDEQYGKGALQLPPPATIPVRDPLLDGESPDTLVEGSKTPPLDKAA